MSSLFIHFHPFRALLSTIIHFHQFPSTSLVFIHLLEGLIFVEEYERGGKNLLAVILPLLLFLLLNLLLLLLLCLLLLPSSGNELQPLCLPHSEIPGVLL